jgi:hypothetical protein
MASAAMNGRQHGARGERQAAGAVNDSTAGAVSDSAR